MISKDSIYEMINGLVELIQDCIITQNMHEHNKEQYRNAKQYLFDRDEEQEQDMNKVNILAEWSGVKRIQEVYTHKTICGKAHTVHRNKYCGYVGSNTVSISDVGNFELNGVSYTVEELRMYLDVNPMEIYVSQKEFCQDKSSRVLDLIKVFKAKG